MLCHGVVNFAAQLSQSKSPVHVGPWLILTREACFGALSMVVAVEVAGLCLAHARFDHAAHLGGVLYGAFYAAWLCRMEG